MKTISFNNKNYQLAENITHKLYFSNNLNAVYSILVNETKTTQLFYVVKSNIFIKVNKITLKTSGYSSDYKAINKTTEKKGYPLKDCGFGFDTASLSKLELV